MLNDFRIFKTVPFFLFFLPLFFVLHGYVQNSASITGGDFLELLGIYLLAATGIFLLSFLFFRRWKKAALFAFSLLFLHFFFGAFQDALKETTSNFFLAKYSVLLPLIFLVYLFLFL